MLIMEEVIPKVIHYCWFGRNPLPPLANDCITSWKKYLPDYEIIEWNEDKFDISSNTYVREAYEQKKYAFVSDYVRLYALYNFGGIYMDTDVEVIKSLDDFLKDQAFSGFEDEDRIPTGIIGSKKHHYFIKQLLDYYNGRHFIKEDGTLDITTNVEIITKICLDNNFIPNNKKQTVCDFTFYPKEYFCPLTYNSLRKHKTKNTYTIHHFAGSWKETSELSRLVKILRSLRNDALRPIKKLLESVLGKEDYEKLKSKLKNN